MKKKFLIIIGILIGALASGLLISGVAYGEINWWDETVAYTDTIDWNDVFNPNSKGQDLYLLVYDKLLNSPERDALKEIAGNYGLTKDEAQIVLNGSITPIFNNPDIKSAQLTLEDAYLIMKNLQEDFEDLSEIFELQSEVDVAIAPSELFANGDLADSGFDLVYDLSVIEEILFLESSDSTIGLPFDDQLSSPFLPTEDDQTISNYVSSETPAAVLGFDFEFDEDNETVKKALVELGDEEIEIDVLEEDVCETDNSFAEALENFENEVSSGGGNVVSGGASGVSGGDGYSVDDLFGTGGDEGDVAESVELTPAKADDWSTSWCPALIGNDSGTTSGTTFGEAGFSSLGGVVSSVIEQSAGAAAWAKDYGLAAEIAVCFDIDYVEKRVSSYLPGDSCVLCELDKINGYMDKTLHHSLMPNKVTGNLMESAKCKSAYGPTPWLDMQIISIAVPVPTPSSDDIIFGKNIFEEWKKYIDMYQPYLYPSTDVVTGFELDYAPEDVTQESIVASVNAALAEEKAEAKLEIEATDFANDATNMSLYTQTILAEIRQMHAFFKGYLQQYNKIGDELCPDIKNKKDVD